MSVKNCESYLQMLLQTGYHDRTNPEIFRIDLNKIDVECRGHAKFTKAFIESQHFNSFRYRDMQKLQSTIAADLVSMVPEHQTNLPW